MPRTRYCNLNGQRFGRLVVVGRESEQQRGRPVKWSVLCDCGTTKIVSSPNLVNGSTKSCGCLRREYLSKSRTIHGQTNTRTYRSWLSMKTRCSNPNYSESHSYSGRGIKICDRWNKFENFLEDMGERPESMTLDRINVDGDYEPSNCKWSTAAEQNKNKRKTKLVNKDRLLNFLKTQSYLTVDQQQKIANNFF